jgi:hypothetical protein
MEVETAAMIPGRGSLVSVRMNEASDIFSTPGG